MGPEEFGGFGDVENKARVQAEATGRKLEEVIDEVSLHFSYPAHGYL